MEQNSISMKVIISLLSLQQMLINFPRTPMLVKLFVNSNFLRLMKKKTKKEKKLNLRLKKHMRIKYLLLVRREIRILNHRFQRKVTRKVSMQAKSCLRSLKWKNLSKTLLTSWELQNTSQSSTKRSRFRIKIATSTTQP